MSDEGGRRNFLINIGQRPEDPSRAKKYDPIYCDLVRKLAEAGAFPETWCAKIGIHWATLYRWADEEPEFEEAVKQGWVLLQHYWTTYAQNNLANTDLRSTVLIKILTSRFPRLYGNAKAPEGTLEHFLARHDPPPMPTPGKLGAGEGDGIDSAAPPRDVILQRIAELEKRLRERATQ